MSRALCIGQHKLFDSTDPADHALARQFCDTCQVIAACSERLAKTQADSTSGGRPEGTVAGQLIAAPRDRKRIAHEDEAYSLDEARRAHNAYQRGDTSRWALVGNRVYSRQIKRRRVPHSPQIDPRGLADIGLCDPPQSNHPEAMSMKGMGR